jgi:hypothetical protein
MDGAVRSVGAVDRVIDETLGGIELPHVSAVGNLVREYGRWYLASCLSINKENIFSLDDFSARDIRDIALLVGPRKVSQTCDIA